MRYIITGSTSFIGVFLCRHLIEEGETVYAVCRTVSNISRLPNSPNLHIIYADIADITTIREMIDIADIFINLAWGGSTQSKRNEFSIHSQNVSNTIKAIKTAKDLGCKLFVESGSQAEYGFHDEIIYENTPCCPVSAYGKAKLEVCNTGMLLSAQLGIKYVHLRIFSVYGENDHSYTLISNSLNKMLINAPLELSTCVQKWNFLYVVDAAKIIVLLAKKIYYQVNVTNEIFNVASFDTRILRSYIEELKEITKSQSLLLYGAYQTDRLLSLSPSMAKTQLYIDEIKLTPFYVGIQNTIHSMKLL